MDATQTMTATVTRSWPTFDAALVDRRLVAERTMAFTFEKPADWTFRAGQFIDITLHEPPETDAKGDTRGFSIASAPGEDGLMVTTRLRDTAFKRVLQAIPLGTTVTVEGPFGDLRLHHAARPAVLLTGGIGITPFRSILVDAGLSGGLPYGVTLFAANRRPVDAPFLDELTALATSVPDLTFVPTMTALDGSEPWDGERGHIDAAMLRRHLQLDREAIYYVTGPAGLVAGLRSMLLGSGVDEDDIRTEEFSGY